MGLDKYYTNKDTAQNCIRKMLDIVPLDAYFIEPSAGDGSFLFEYTKEAYDILPENPVVQQADFLKVFSEKENICFYGNPPFGKRNALTKQFISHCLSFHGAKWLAFILPMCFKKHTQQRIFPFEWSLVSEIILPVDSFTARGSPYKIPCVFQVWEKESVLADLRQKERTSFRNEHFSISTKVGDFFVMGASPSTLKTPHQVTSNNRGYWLTTDMSFDNLQAHLKEVPWKGYSSAGGGVAWWTKQDFINQYERHFKIGEFRGQQ